jgi:hypothetical protein
MNGNTPDNLIPLVNVTDGPTLEEVLAKAIPEGVGMIQNADQFALVVIEKPDEQGNQNINMSAGCSDHALIAMTVQMIGLVGAGQLGERMQNMPTEVARATAQMIGFQTINQYLRDQAQRTLAAADPQTPAEDIKPTER